MERISRRVKRGPPGYTENRFSPPVLLHGTLQNILTLIPELCTRMKEHITLKEVFWVVEKPS